MSITADCQRHLPGRIRLWIPDVHELRGSCFVPIRSNDALYLQSRHRVRGEACAYCFPPSINAVKFIFQLG